MITFDDWKIESVGYPLAMQYDHMTRELYISGDIPDGYTWDVLCRYKRELNIIRLEVVEGGISPLLTKHDLANSGTYIIQLRGTKDGTVKHSNAIQVEVPKSLSGDDQWPLVPSEFSQMEARINAIAKAADDLNNHPPIPGNNGYWLIWDTDRGAYVESDLPLPEVSSGGRSWNQISGKPFDTIDGNTLVNRSGALCVNTTDDAEQDNTRPITSSGVHVICGNINALLQAI